MNNSFDRNNALLGSRPSVGVMKQVNLVPIPRLSDVYLQCALEQVSSLRSHHRAAVRPECHVSMCTWLYIVFAVWLQG